MGWINSMLTGIENGAASLGSMMASKILAGVKSVASSLVAHLIGLMKDVFGGLRDVVVGAFQGGVALIKAAVVGLVGAIGALGAGMAKAIQHFTALGRSINDLSASTGLSRGMAGGVLGRFGALGASAGDVSGMFGGQNPAMFGMKASVYGLPSYTDAHFAERLAGRYQSMQSSGMMGQQMARGMLGGLGMDNEAGRRIASTPVSEIRSQLGFQSRVQSTLGVNPEMIGNVSRQFDLLTGRLKILGGTVLVRLAAVALPRLNVALEKVTEYLAANAGKIGDLITNTINGFFKVIEMVPQVLSNAAKGALDFAIVAVDAMPKIWSGFLDGISIVQNAGGQLWDFLSKGFEDIGSRLSGVLDGILAGLDSIWKSDFVQTVVKALPAAKTVVDVANRATGVGRDVGETVARDLSGGDDSWGAVGKLAGGAVAGGAVAGKLLWNGAKGLLGMGGGASAGGAAGGSGSLLGRGASWLWNAVPAPVKIVVGGGLALGGLGYTALQRTGVLGKDAPGFMEALGNVNARMPWGNGEVTQQNGYTAAANAAMQSAGTPGPISEGARRVMGGLQRTASQEWQSLNHRSSWANTLDSRFGETISRRSGEAHDALERMRASLGDGKSGKQDDLTQIMREVLRQLQIGNDLQARTVKGIDGVQQGLDPFAKRLGDQVLQNAAEGQFLALTR